MFHAVANSILSLQWLLKHRSFIHTSHSNENRSSFRVVVARDVVARGFRDKENDENEKQKDLNVVEEKPAFPVLHVLVAKSNECVEEPV